MGEVLPFPTFVKHRDPNGWECGSNVKVPGGYTGRVSQIDNRRPDSIQVKLNSTGAVAWHRPTDLTPYKPFLITKEPSLREHIDETSFNPPLEIPKFLQQGPDDGDAA